MAILSNAYTFPKCGGFRKINKGKRKTIDINIGNTKEDKVAAVGAAFNWENQP
jgi:hypothetical protein